MEAGEDKNNLIKLKSKDGEIFTIEENCLDKAKIFKELKQVMDLKEEINSKTLKKIIEYLKHYANEEPQKIPKPLPNPDLKSILNEWDYNYIISPPLEDIIDLINAADYMNIQELVDLLSARVASEMTNCSPDEAREKFGVCPDMTEEEVRYYDKYPFNLD